MMHSKAIAAALRAKKTDIKKVMASADLTLSQKALRGRSDVSQSIMCLRVANKLRRVTYDFNVPLDVVHEHTGISMRSLLDVDCRSVLISIVKLAVIEVALDGYLKTLETDYRSFLDLVGEEDILSAKVSDRWRKWRYNKNSDV